MRCCAKGVQRQLVPLSRRTVAGLPHVAAGAARGVGARGPLAVAVLRDVVAPANALQRVQLAHAQKHGPRGRNGGGAQIQRRSGEGDTSERQSHSVALQSHHPKWRFLAAPALKRHFANTFSAGRLLPRFALHHWMDLRFCHCGLRANINARQYKTQRI